MGAYQEHRAALRLKQRQEHAAQQEEQRRINEEAEAAGAGGVVLDDQRDLEGKALLPVSNKARTPSAENKAAPVDAGAAAAPKRTTKRSARKSAKRAR